MEYSKTYFLRYLSANEEVRKASKNHWLRIHAAHIANVEFKQYGELFETLFIVQAKKEKYKLYNKNKVNDECLWTVLYFFGIQENIRYSLRDALNGTEPHCIKIMKKDSRAYLLSKINDTRKAAGIEIE